MKLIIANWKMNGQMADLQPYVEGLSAQLNATKAVKLVICPPAPLLPQLASLIAGNVQVVAGAQDCGSKANGAETGNISPVLLQDIGCEFVIIGHSERRNMGESAILPQKLKAALEAGLTPIFCVGHDVMAELLALNSPDIDSSKIWVAYEPVWAIGTGKTPTPAEIAEMTASIRQAAPHIKGVLYGGSVDQNNAASLLGAGIDGLLVGGASLDAAKFAAIANCAA